MKRKVNSRAAKETIRSNDVVQKNNSAENGIDSYPGMLGIEIGAPYSRRFEPPYVSGHSMRDDSDEEEEDYDLCQ